MTSVRQTLEGTRVDVPGLVEYIEAAGLDDEILLAMLESFLEESPRQAAALRAACESGDLDATTSAAHALKSSAGTLKANHLADLLQRTETTAREGDPSARGYLPRILEELQHAQEIFAAEVARR